MAASCPALRAVDVGSSGGAANAPFLPASHLEVGSWRWTQQPSVPTHMITVWSISNLDHACQFCLNVRFHDSICRTYKQQFDPVSVDGSVGVELFFAPDHSIDTITNLLQDAPSGSRIDVGTPGFDSWISCTDSNNGCVGCTVDVMKGETFSVFPAILNAVHERGCSVRLLTNNYNTPTCTGKIADLDWLALQDAIEVKYFTSVTFLHEKYVAVHPPVSSRSKSGDNATGTGRKASVSSVNFSQTSFMKNREAGVIINGDSDNGAKLADYLDAVFEMDWATGINYTVNNTYSSAEMAIITSMDALPVAIPPGPSIPGEFVTPAPTPIATSSDSSTGLFVSPDFAISTLLGELNSSTTSLEVHIYQVTDDALCDKLQDMHASGINVTLLVSSDIYSTYDKNGARYCYKQLYDAGLKIRLTPSFFTYSHQKYWIIDGKKLGLSTGNWSPTDFNWPAAGEQWPPYSSAGWQDSNRDIQFWTTDQTVITAFRTLLLNDFAAGSDYTPSW